MEKESEEFLCCVVSILNYECTVELLRNSDGGRQHLQHLYYEIFALKC